ncbi:MAG: hypothetical protein ACRDVO_10830, partial [Jiangellaceae bacterium]
MRLSSLALERRVVASAGGRLRPLQLARGPVGAAFGDRRLTLVGAVVAARAGSDDKARESDRGDRRCRGQEGRHPRAPRPRCSDTPNPATHQIGFLRGRAYPLAGQRDVEASGHVGR